MKNSTPLISIVMATYNGAKYIEEQLNSIVLQEYINFEIIIVDDFSSDNTIQIINKFIEFHKEVSISLYLNTQNIGVNNTFDRAMSVSKGDFIAIADQDDIWLPNKLVDAINNIGQYSLIYSNSLLIDESSKSLNRRKFRKTKFYTGKDSRVLSMYNDVSGHTIVFKSDILKYVLPIPKHCHYDWWIAFVATNFNGVKFLQEPYVLHRIHPKNVSIGMKNETVEQGFESFNNWVNTMLSLQDLKNKSYFIELKSILDKDSIYLKKILLVIFKIKYRKYLYYNKNYFSALNKARKLHLPHVPN